MWRIACLVMALAACDQGAKPEPPPPPTKPKPEPVKTVDWLRYLPVDADVVYRIDVAAIRRTKYWAQYAPKVTKHFAPWFGSCGYDPLSQLSSIAGASVGTDRHVLVFRGLDRGKTLECLRSAKSTPLQNITVEPVGPYVSITNGNTLTTLTFVDPTTLVLALNTNRETLAEIVRSGAPLDKSAALLELDARIPRDAVMAMFMAPGSKKLTDTLGKKPLDTYGFAHLGNTMKLDFFMRFASPADATSLADQLRPSLKGAQTMFEVIEVAARDATVEMSIAMTDKQLETVFSAVLGW